MINNHLPVPTQDPPELNQVSDFREITCETIENFVRLNWLINLHWPSTNAPKLCQRKKCLGLLLKFDARHSRLPSNIVEGCAKSSHADYSRFLEIAYGSLCEVEYQLSLAERLRNLDAPAAKETTSLANETGRVLTGLRRSLKSDS